ncbi:CPBP family intramembrane glutamic endopeptidase [[Bacillus] enclensis]|uniref:CPBP family intramembrane glutamic endopeptidase n=1 Tax=[Bacillus] enclensis TaxID=1402860 RepID=UPI0018DD87D6|nr:CPBP family intramembrane glutamic endopeptidase [[Bacillus] enclensis]MBH9966035.1 CPBP family intramembrane metalloprotease [[Bacillus] enclensis]
MDTQMIISIIILITLAEAGAVILFVKYRRGDMETNPFVTILKKEWVVFYHALFKWKIRDSKEDRTYAYHKGSNYFWLFIALIHEQVIEAFAFHYYLKEVDPLRANILVVLHIYTILYMLGDYNLVRNSPIRMKGNHILMKIGERRSLRFHIGDVAAIQPARTQYRNNGGIIHEKNVFHVTALPRVLTRIFGMIDELRYEVIFKEPIYARGYFGQKQEVHKALIYMEQPEALIKDLQEKAAGYDENEEAEEERLTAAATEGKRPALINWKVYFTLLFLNLLGALAIAPYAMARENLHEVMGMGKLSFTLFYVVQVLLEAGLLLFIALCLAKKVKLGAPVIDAIFNRSKPLHSFKKKGIQSAVFGVLAGVSISVFSLIVSKPLGVDNSSLNEPSWWLGMLGSFGAAVNEESIFRLFLITLILWLFLKFTKGTVTKPKIWTAIVLSSLVFGIMHFSVAASSLDMTLGVVLSMLVINGIGGLVFGALFVIMGIEFAMIAHFTADLVIHVAGPRVVE